MAGTIIIFTVSYVSKSLLEMCQYHKCLFRAFMIANGSDAFNNANMRISMNFIQVIVFYLFGLPIARTNFTVYLNLIPISDLISF